MAAPHRHSGSCGCAEEAKQADAVGTSLYPSIDRAGIWCLNAAHSDGGLRAVKPWDARNDDRRLLSDADDGEMMLHIPFSTAVHIRSLACMVSGLECICGSPRAAWCRKGRRRLTAVFAHSLLPLCFRIPLSCFTVLG